MRVTSKEGTRGSLKWIQRLINDHADLLDAVLIAAKILAAHVMTHIPEPDIDCVGCSLAHHGSND